MDETVDGELERSHEAHTASASQEMRRQVEGQAGKEKGFVTYIQ